jgi:HPr kinase/phosphorylase
MSSAAPLHHATAICIDGQGVAIVGKSGSGKSDLALRLIDRGATLICDDYVVISEIENKLMLTPASNITGKIEIRGLGIIRIPYVDSAPLRLYVNLDMTPERHPDLWQTIPLNGYHVPMIAVSPFATSAPILIEMAIQKLVEDAIFPTETQI